MRDLRGYGGVQRAVAAGGPLTLQLLVVGRGKKVREWSSGLDDAAQRRDRRLGVRFATGARYTTRNCGGFVGDDDRDQIVEARRSQIAETVGQLAGAREQGTGRRFG